MTQPNAITIRAAAAVDAERLHRVAPPQGGRRTADAFRPTREVIELVRRRRQQILAAGADRLRDRRRQRRA